MASHTNDIAEALRTLHRIHRSIERFEGGGWLAAPRLSKAHDASVAKLQKAYDEIKDEYTKLRMSVDEKQLQLSTNEASVKKRESQLIQASDNREYQALKDQIAADGMANSVLGRRDSRRPGEDRGDGRKGGRGGEGADQGEGGSREGEGSDC